jgi:hypothetical protein
MRLQEYPGIGNREFELLLLIGSDKRAGEIARLLSLSDKTIGTYLSGRPARHAMSGTCLHDNPTRPDSPSRNWLVLLY